MNLRLVCNHPALIFDRELTELPDKDVYFK
jgi:SNF2 family DNA or RNA helicase